VCAVLLNVGEKLPAHLARRGNADDGRVRDGVARLERQNAREKGLCVSLGDGAGGEWELETEEEIAGDDG